MNLSDVINTVSTRKKKDIVGRGQASGSGKLCNRGMRGFHCRSGNHMNPTLEGGQMPLFRRLPHRGFNNKEFANIYAAVNLYLLERGYKDGETVNYETLKARGLVDLGCHWIKVLGTGELTKKLTVVAEKITDSAKEKIEKAGGKVILTAPVETPKIEKKTKKVE
jgi:large subunit ribosomal protein L15